MMNYSILDDATLAQEARYNAEAFSVLYRRHVTPVYRYLYRRLRNPRDAEDLTAQVFMAVLEGLSCYRADGQFCSWLFGIARRKLADYYRQTLAEPLEEAIDDSSDLQLTIEKKEMQAHLAYLISKLDEERQEVLRLRFGAGLGFSDIADLLRRSEGAVKMTLYRTLDWLKTHWENDHE